MATRFYFRAAATPDVSPTFVLTTNPYTETGQAVRRKMLTTALAGDTLTSVTANSSTSTASRLHLQGVSDPMVSGLTFDTGVTYSSQIQAREGAANDNCDTHAALLIYSEDGATVRHVIRSAALQVNAAEFSIFRENRAWFNATAGTGSYTTVAGDRLVVYIGHVSITGVSPSGTVWCGSDSANTDLPVDQTDTTTTKNPWFETSLDITFVTAGGEVGVGMIPIF